MTQDNQKKFSIKNILLIDDNPLIITILSRGLKNRCPNFNIDAFINPREALDFIRSKERDYFDLILTDIEMPEITGIELTKYIREKLKITKDSLPILVYSSREDFETMREAELVGCNDYYTKPRNTEIIARNVSKWILNDYIPNSNVIHEKIFSGKGSLKGLNIILSDDQRVRLMMLAKKFQESGANIFRCHNGGEITNLIKKDPTKYHMIITDICMEKVDAIEEIKLVRKIQTEYNKKYNTNYKIPIIASSIDDNKDTVVKILNDGVDDYIVKGCDTDSIIKLSKFWIDCGICNAKGTEIRLLSSH
jgi:CheY-like chemotaxis protein